jgi:ribosome-interacting GTPase 1
MAVEEEHVQISYRQALSLDMRGWRVCMQEYKIHNADVLFKEDCDMDDLIDVIEGNRRYVRCL